ncbi:MAG TPA: carboxyl transferase domain-containing protein [Candidatus Kapabacteria bacterium]|jgi:3-methylcrotonyl-CoA carboxylase beta subunit|nr:carboxyl transferase domain-containing protein [Candidatus Kapabacteria bacterium]
MAKTIGKPIERTLAFEKNVDGNKELLRIINERAAKTKQGGGTKAQEKLKEKNKMPVRERITALIDEGSNFLEIGLFVADGMYVQEGGAPSAGVVTGIGLIHGRECLIVANDPTVKAGAWFPMTAKKNMRIQEIAIENKVPIIYLVDSAGVFLPMQDEIFPDKEHFGRQFRNNAVLSAMGVPQIAAIMGPCVAGGAYLPIMSDEALIVEGNGSLFLAGPALVEAAIGEKTDIDPLGGAMMHSTVSGVIDYKVKDDSEAIKTIRSLVSKFSPLKGKKNLFERSQSYPPLFDSEEIFGILPTDRAKPYSTYDFLARIIDNSELDEYKADYGKTIICGYARIDGWAVGIVANNREVVKNGKGEIQIGGVIYSESADKAARFINNCNQRGIPLVFFQDVTGFMVGTRAEQGGIIKDGAKMVNAVANSVVPKFTFIVGNSYGAGNYAMCGKAYDPRLIFAYPSGQIAVMGGAQASKTLLTLKTSNLRKEGKTLSENEEKAMLKEIKDKYDETTTPLYAASQLWIDGIISPTDTRSIVSIGLACASHQDSIPEWKSGVLQV